MSSIQFSALRFIMVAPILLLITGIVERGIRIEKRLGTFNSGQHSRRYTLSNAVYGIR